MFFLLKKNPKYTITTVFYLSVSLSFLGCMNDDEHHHSDDNHNILVEQETLILNKNRAIKQLALAYKVSTDLARFDSNISRDSTVILSPSIITITNKILSDIPATALQAITKKCNVSGSKNVSNLNTGPAHITLIYKNCIDETKIFNGSVTLHRKLSDTTFDGSVRFNNFSTADNNRFYTLNGGYDLRVNRMPVNSFVIVGDKLSIESQNKNMTIRNFNFVFESNLSTQLETLRVKYDLNYVTKNSVVVININSQSAINITIGNSFAFKADLRVTEALGTRSRLVVNSGVGHGSDTVTINPNLDAIGNNPDKMKVMSWQQLISQ